MNTRLLCPTAFADTLSAPAPEIDPIEQMAAQDRADWTLLRLVLCTALATLLLAAASTLPL